MAGRGKARQGALLGDRPGPPLSCMVRTYRTLPLTLYPRNELEESLAGYLDRLAAFLDVPLLTLLYRTGLITEELFSSLPVGYGVSLQTHVVRNFAKVTRMSEPQARDLLLTRYNGICWDSSSLDASFPDSFRKVALSSWAYFVGSHVCPKCLMNSGGVWRLNWKLPWSFACIEHGVLLADTCPGCRRRIGVGRRDGRSAPAFPSLVPIPTSCRNTLPKGLASGGRSSKPCGYDLRSVETIDVAFSELLNVQQCIDTVLSGAGDMVAGEQVSSLDYFRDLRSLCALLLSVGEPEDLGDVPDSVGQAFAHHAETRCELQGQRQELVVAGEDWRTAPRLRPYTGPPQNAKLMAALCSSAVPMLRAGNTEELAEAIEPYVERMRKDPRPSQALQSLAYFGFSPRLQAAIDQCWLRHQKATIRLGMGPGGNANRRDSTLHGLRPEHAPQLFWEEEFERHLAELLPGVTSDSARRTCSMWLVKSIRGCTWKEAAGTLGIPPKRGRAMANKVVSLLNANETLEIFDSRVRDCVRRISLSGDLTDYGARRCCLTKFTDIGRDEWKEITYIAGVHPGKRGGRSRYAAAWVWSERTSGDYRLSPAFRDSCTISDREAYRSFTNNTLPALQDLLTSYGQQIMLNKEDRTSLTPI